MHFAWCGEPIFAAIVKIPTDFQKKKKITALDSNEANLRHHSENSNRLCYCIWTMLGSTSMHACLHFVPCFMREEGGCVSIARL